MKSSILNAQVNHVLNQILITGLLSIAVVTLTSFVLQGHYPVDTITAWCGISYFILIARIVFFSWLKRGPHSPQRYRVIRISLVITLLLSSVIWGSAALLFLKYPHNQEFVFVSLVIAGMVSGALPSLSAYLPGYFSFVIPTFSILIYQYHSLGMIASSWLAAIHMIGLIGISISLQRVITNSITIDLKNSELLTEVIHAKDEAERANRAKSLFLAAASHDLRQPLHAMGLLLSTLCSRLADSAFGTRTILNQLVQSHDALTQLFNSLLQISRLESGAVEAHIVSVDLAATLEALIAEFKPSAHIKNLDIVEQWQNFAIRTDPILLNRVLRNLLSNAIKFTEHGAVKIITERSGDYVELAIVDTGIGIPVEEQENIFQEYYQLGNSARDRTEGIGLGLSIVEKTSRLLGHEVRVKSAAGQGSCFTVRIALGNPYDIIDELDSPIAATISGYSVLVIDDDQSVLQAMQIMLESWSCRAITADSLTAALALLEQTNTVPDIIISDYRLKEGVTGLEAVGEIWTRLQKNIPTILITGDTDPELIRQIRQHQVFLLHKPVKATQLQNTMRQLLDNQLKSTRFRDTVGAIVSLEQTQ